MSSSTTRNVSCYAVLYYLRIYDGESWIETSRTSGWIQKEDVCDHIYTIRSSRTGGHIVGKVNQTDFVKQDGKFRVYLDPRFPVYLIGCRLSRRPTASEKKGYLFPKIDSTKRSSKITSFIESIPQMYP
ncbi:hypothetical protein COU54_01360 [Candidatus Pacearchaeota archaeon CG10_big_fil_rev_8_21_14_0_10_31_24]|nr:MAG: hypothetical protein COU54_01360 [Candidatus Pacearchaeota archaeon CG10_big_fil_rev_8_21_14_0_10_31_24]